MEDVMMKDVVDIEEKILWLHFFLINLLTWMMHNSQGPTAFIISYNFE